MVKTTIGISVLFLAATFTLSSCEKSGDTVVSVNYSLEGAITDAYKAEKDKRPKDWRDILITKIHIKIAPDTGNPVEGDLPVTFDDGVGITSFTYKRFVMNGVKGSAAITADAIDKDGNKMYSAAATYLDYEHPCPDLSPRIVNRVPIIANEAVAAYLGFTLKPKPPTPEACSSSGTGGSSAAVNGSGGSSGTGGSGSGGSGSGGSGVSGSGGSSSGSGGSGSGVSGSSGNGGGGNGGGGAGGTGT